jgi:hypothetical protein
VAVAAIASGRVGSARPRDNGHAEESLSRLVTGRTRNAGYGGVIHRRAGECREIGGRMTCLAGRTIRWYVCRWHSRCLHCVVASGTSGRHSVVIEERS